MDLDNKIKLAIEAKTQKALKEMLENFSLREKLRLLMEVYTSFSSDEKTRNTKSKVITSSLSMAEKKEFDSTYLPLLNTIFAVRDDLIDLRMQLNYDALYVNSHLKEIAIYTDMVEHLNKLLPVVHRAAEKENPENAHKEESYSNIYAQLSYIHSLANHITIELSENGEYFFVNASLSEIKIRLHNFTENLTRVKTYFAALAEFAKAKNIEEFIPSQFEEYEKEFSKDYASNKMYSKKELNRIIHLDDKERTMLELAQMDDMLDYVGVDNMFPDYDEIEPDERLLGENNIVFSKWEEIKR